MIELLFIEGCPSATQTEALLRRVLAEEGCATPVTKIVLSTPEQAVATGFLGSPTIRIDGRDIEPARAEELGGALGCRLYPTARGHSGVPPEELVRAAVRTLPHAAERTP